MTDFRYAGNGYIGAQVSDSEASTLFRNLAALRRDSFNDFSVLMEGHLPIEAIRTAQVLTGGDFVDWMRVNADSPLQGLVRDILNYLNGKVGHFTIKTSIKIHEERLRPGIHYHEATYTPGARSESTLDGTLRNGARLFNFDLFRLMAGIGPVDVCRIFLLLGGATYYAEQ